MRKLSCIMLLLSVALLFSVSGCSDDKSYTTNVTYLVPEEEVDIVPPGVLPVVFISGTPSEMGYQYGEQLKDYIVRVKNSLWAQLLANDDKETILDHLSSYNDVIENEAPEMVLIMDGIAAGAGVDYEDILMINCFVDVAWARPVETCSGFAAWGSATVPIGDTQKGKTIAAINFDFPMDPFAYRATIIAYPDEGNSFIGTGYAGVLANNFTLNEKGLVELNNHGEYFRDEDKGYGLPAMLIAGYIAMTCNTSEEAREFMFRATLSMGVVRHFQNIEGDGCVVESTADKAMARYAGDFGEDDYLIDTNHWVMPGMADTKWDRPRPGSSEYRYMTIEEFVQDQYGSLDVNSFMDILGESEKYWDGSEWVYVDGWSPNTLNSVGSPGGGTHTCHIAVPEDKTVYLRMGDATGLWGTLAPSLTGEFVKLVLEDSPASVTATAASSAQHNLWLASQAMVGSTDLDLIDKLNETKEVYWEGLAVQAEAALQTGDEALKSYSKAATCFCKTQAYALQVQRIAESS